MNSLWLSANTSIRITSKGSQVELFKEPHARMDLLRGEYSSSFLVAFNQPILLHSCKIWQLGDFSVPHSRKNFSFYHSNPFHINYFDQIQLSPRKTVGSFGGLYSSKYGTLHGTGIKPTSSQLKLDVSLQPSQKKKLQIEKCNFLFCSFVLNIILFSWTLWRLQVHTYLRCIC